MLLVVELRATGTKHVLETSILAYMLLGLLRKRCVAALVLAVDIGSLNFNSFILARCGGGWLFSRFLRRNLLLRQVFCAWLLLSGSRMFGFGLGDLRLPLHRLVLLGNVCDKCLLKAACGLSPFAIEPARDFVQE